mgnify:FL=1
MSDENRREFLVNYAVDQLVKYLIEDNEMPIEQALNRVYTSRTFALLNDPEADLTSESPAYIYELLKREITQSHNLQNE